MDQLRGKVRQHILIERAQVKDDHLSPSSLEIYDSMRKYLRCQDAIYDWNADWTKCPVCGSEVDEFGEPPYHFKVIQ